jgi:hypothetical protein
LNIAGGGWIGLSEDLGALLATIWKVNSYGDRFLGMLTIKTMLTRLGKTDIGEQIKQAQAAAKAEREKNKRNRIREQARELATKLQCFRDEFPDLVTSNDIDIIAALEREN